MNLERSWETNYFWFWLLTTVTDMFIIDMYRWYRNILSKIVIPRIQEQYDVDTLFYEIMAIKFCDMLCKNLEGATQKQSVLRIARSNPTAGDTFMKLERIRGKDGHVTHTSTAK